MEILANLLGGPLYIQALGKVLRQFIPFSTCDLLNQGFICAFPNYLQIVSNSTVSNRIQSAIYSGL